MLYAAIPANAQTTPNDYDSDDDNLIEVSTLDQLNAIRYDLNGDGDPTPANTSTYYAAFPNPATTTRMGCRTTCIGYELDANLNFDADNSGSVTSTDPYPNWTPIGGSYSAVFDGNGRTIRNLTIDRSSSGNTGLFAGIASGGIVRNVGMVNASMTARGTYTGILAGRNDGTITAAYAQGGSIAYSLPPMGISGTTGGLVGGNFGTIRASYSTASLDVGSNANTYVGVLTGYNQNGIIIASYGAGSATGTSSLSYFGGLIGHATGNSTAVTDSYCDTSTTTSCIGQTHSSASGVTVAAKTTAELQTPQTYTGIYRNWNISLDADVFPDNPWSFGSTTTYPTLNTPAQRQTTADYDGDDDGLIDVDSLDKLNAIRYDLNGDGLPDSTSTGVYLAYAAAFPGGDLAAASSTRMGCVAGCTGYELTDDLDFDADGVGGVTSTDPYPNWPPIGGGYAAVFNGRGHIISNLTITGNSGNSGLFAGLASSGVVRDVGMIDASVSSSGTYVGVLAGTNLGTIIAVSVQGGSVAVTVRFANVGGLVGYNSGIIRASYSTASVSAGAIIGTNIGGLMGLSNGTTTASYAAGRVSGTRSGADVGGFVGQANSGTAIVDSHCDTTVHSTTTLCIGRSASGASAAVAGQTTADLQTPTGYTGIYANWNINLDTGSTSTPQYPWYFGTTSTYLVLNNPAQRLAQRTGIAPPPPPQPPTSTPPTTPTSTPSTSTPPTSPTSTPSTSTPPTTPTSTAPTSTPPTSPTSTPSTSTPPTTPTSTPATSTPPTTPTSTPSDPGNGDGNGGNGESGGSGNGGSGGGDSSPPPAPPPSLVTAAETVAPYDAETAHPEVYANAQYEMTASCQTHDSDPETGDPRSATITFDLGSYDGPILLTLSIWRNERYMAYETQDIPLPSLERDGRAATVRVETDPGQTRFRLDGRRHGLAVNLVLGYADCRSDD